MPAETNSVTPSYRTHSKLPHTNPLSRCHWSQGTQNHRDFLGPDPSYNFNYSNSSHTRGLRYRTTPYDCTSHLPFRRDLHHYRHSPEVSTSNSYSFLQSTCLQHWFKNWQEQRRHKLTASTFGAAIGFWRGRRGKLWLEKLGLIEPFSGNIATCWNNIQEEVALERYKLITGNSVCFPKFQLYNKAHTEDDWLGASPDGVVENDVYGLPCGGVLEVKCPLHYGEAGQAFPWSRIPLHCMPQAQGLMEILDKNWMDFYVWTPNGSSLFRLQRNREYWELLRSALSDFWWIHVQPAKELCHLDPTADPFTIVRHLQPAPRHELCSTIVYASKCLVDESKLLVREINGKMQN
eukprot:TRINITY_DN8612_c0_g1_i3.p1 TRINITY_DN8612_c0_g1~~TRINITY_DN8612_c0_g1_i3.p1  ORF type:complete len:349 (-),score=45.28 TRINITY_DN8612_c0_g1_i3:646-1692(-)